MSQCWRRPPATKYQRNHIPAGSTIWHRPIRVAERDEPELRGGKYDQILRHAADVRHREARPHHELNNEVTVAHAIHAVLRDGVEPKLLREKLAVHRKRVARKRARTKGQDGNARDELLQSLEICTEGERVREQ